MLFYIVWFFVAVAVAYTGLVLFYYGSNLNFDLSKYELSNMNYPHLGHNIFYALFMAGGVYLAVIPAVAVCILILIFTTERVIKVHKVKKMEKRSD